jgi:hypothetical protein
VFGARVVLAVDGVRHERPRVEEHRQPDGVDSQAFGRLYVSPVSLASFEENAGETNTSLVRFEGNAAFGIERVDRGGQDHIKAWG